MTKKLLFIILPMLFFATLAIAQNHVWDFGNDETNFPVAAGFTDTRVIDGLTFVGGGSLFATVQANGNETWPAGPGEGYTSINRLRSEGSSSPSAGIPTRRYMQFTVTGPVSIKLWYRFSGTSLPRAVVVADASGTEIMRFNSLGDTDRRYIEGDYTGGAGDLLVFSEDNAVNYYKLEISSTLLSTDDFKSPVSSNIKAVGDRIYVSNVKTSTEVNIYSITGALVKSLKTNTDTDFSFKSGLWIASLKTSEGQKAVKLVTH